MDRDRLTITKRHGIIVEGLGEEDKTEKEWKTKFRETIQQKAKTALSWQDYTAVMLRGRGEDC